MKILVFSDIHGDTRALERLMAIEADYYFAAGDMVSWARGLDAVGEILARRGGRVYVLPGNHESEALIAGICRRHGLNEFHGRTLMAGAFRIAGLGYSTPTPFNTPGEYTEEQMASRLSAFATVEPDVLICHCPPRGTALDRMGPKHHAGSLAVREFIERHQPRLFVCGHIHEAHGAAVRIGRTDCRNAGKNGCLIDLATLES
jgi:hypothetical protein